MISPPHRPVKQNPPGAVHYLWVPPPRFAGRGRGVVDSFGVFPLGIGGAAPAGAAAALPGKRGRLVGGDGRGGFTTPRRVTTTTPPAKPPHTRNGLRTACRSG